MAKKKEEIIEAIEETVEAGKGDSQEEKVLGTTDEPVKEETSEVTPPAEEPTPENPDTQAPENTPEEDKPDPLEEGPSVEETPEMSTDPSRPDPVMAAGADVETIPPPVGSRAASLEDKVAALAGAVAYLASNASAQVAAEVKRIYPKAFE